MGSRLNPGRVQMGWHINDCNRVQPCYTTAERCRFGRFDTQAEAVAAALAVPNEYSRPLTDEQMRQIIAVSRENRIDLHPTDNPFAQGGFADNSYVLADMDIEPGMATVSTPVYFDGADRTGTRFRLLRYPCIRDGRLGAAYQAEMVYREGGHMRAKAFPLGTELNMGRIEDDQKLATELFFQFYDDGTQIPPHKIMNGFVDARATIERMSAVKPSARHYTAGMSRSTSVLPAVYRDNGVLTCDSCLNYETVPPSTIASYFGDRSTRIDKHSFDISWCCVSDDDTGWRLRVCNDYKEPGRAWSVETWTSQDPQDVLAYEVEDGQDVAAAVADFTRSHMRFNSEQDAQAAAAWAQFAYEQVQQGFDAHDARVDQRLRRFDKEREVIGSMVIGSLEAKMEAEARRGRAREARRKKGFFKGLFG